MVRAGATTGGNGPGGSGAQGAQSGQAQGGQAQGGQAQGGGGGGNVCNTPGECGPTEWCDFPDNLCGQGVPGTCMPRPQGCNDIYQPTCTCAGSVAGNPCEGASMGSDANALGGCMPPAGTFACGETFCDTNLSFCRHTGNDVFGEADLFQCEVPTTPCTIGLSCMCLATDPCGNNCTESGPGEVTVFCPGG